MIHDNERLHLVDFTKALGDRYLAYALSTIMSRSLPDVRDGLKPVNRRLLYAMHLLRLNPTTPPKKSARIVGDVIGKFHPHGEAAIYATLVRLAQEFTLRYPLVEGQGNFGNIDGDDAASMRYTEAKMTEVALALLEGIGDHTIDFRPTYDGSEEEPTVLPAAFPNLLANGSIGIAVGMATNIPPHNVDELAQAMKMIIKRPDVSVADLMTVVAGPDFPTGGILVEDHPTIVKAYETGRGSLRLRARYEVEDLKGGQYQIIVTEMPYQVQKGKLIEDIAQLLFDKKLLLLGDVRDESTDEVRLVLVPKSRLVEPEMLMATLFRQTDLEVRVGLNMNVLDAQHVPRVMDLKEILRAYLDHRYEVNKRRLEARGRAIDSRLEVLRGLQCVFLNLDEVIRIIRFEDHPKALLKERWQLTEVQVEAILNMRLRSLQKLEEITLTREIEALDMEAAALTLTLSEDAKVWALIDGEMDELRKKFGKKTSLGKRRTEVRGAPQETALPLEAMIEKEPVTLLCSRKGWVRTLKGHVDNVEDVKYKEGDEPWWTAKGYTTDHFLVFVASGRFYTLSVDQLPKGRGMGEPLALLLDLPQSEEIINVFVESPSSPKKFLVASTDGRGFLVAVRDVVAQTKNGKQILNVGGDIVAKGAYEGEGDHVAIMGQNRRLLVFPLAELPEMGRGRGVMLQKYRGGGLSDIQIFDSTKGLLCRKGEKTQRIADWAQWVGTRGAPGRFAPPGFPKSNKFF